MINNTRHVNTTDNSLCDKSLCTNALRLGIPNTQPYHILANDTGAIVLAEIKTKKNRTNEISDR